MKPFPEMARYLGLMLVHLAAVWCAIMRMPRPDATALPAGKSVVNVQPAFPSHSYVCGDNRCRCDGTVAVCSPHQCVFTDHKYIPALPPIIRTLNLKNNCLTSDVLSQEFFANASQMTALSLEQNFLRTIPNDVFRLIPNLTSLNVSFNSLVTGVLLYPLSIPTLTELGAIMALSTFPAKEIFHELDSNLRVLKMSNNFFPGTVNLSLFCSLKHLAELTLKDCRIETTVLDCPLPLLKTLQLENNDKSSFPPTCDSNNASLLPSLERVSATRTIFLYMEKLCLPKLRWLSFSGYNDLALGPRVFDSLPSLQTVLLTKDMRLSTPVVVIRNDAFQGPDLKVVSLAGNRIDFSNTVVVEATGFSNCTQLQTLILDDNNFLDVDVHRFLQLFGTLRSLRFLSLQRCQVGDMLMVTFSNFPQLRRLDLIGNRIASIPDGTFDSLPHFHFLDMSVNKLSRVNEKTFGADTRHRMTALYLGGNAFVCDCGVLWFRNWLTSNPSLFYRSHSPASATSILGARLYLCRNKPVHGIRVEDFNMNEQPCLLSKEVNMILSAFCLLLIVALAGVSLLTRYRWHIRLLLYEAFRGRGNLRRQRLMANDFRYDLFVSYAAGDEPWIRQHLIPELEEQLGIRLCIHERDFIPGRNIVDNIVNSVESSKKIMMVYSKDFACSHWCQFELTLCLRHVMNCDDALIIVCVDDVHAHDMTAAMLAVLKTTTYIQWHQQADAIRAFWGRLRIALEDVFLRDNDNF